MYTIKILRQDAPDSPKYYQYFSYDGNAVSIAELLNELNRRNPLTDIDKKTSRPIAWECSCMVRKCGTCAMRINGVPQLACSAFLKDCKKKTIILEPLSKFPVVRDLIVDRSFIFDSLKKMNLWLDDEAWSSEWTHEQRYQSSRCLMCGCCLEVCPNFNVNSEFIGAISPINSYRILDQSKDIERKQDLSNNYEKFYFNGCGKSLACHNICPIGLPVEELIVRSNAIAIWKR